MPLAHRQAQMQLARKVAAVGPVMPVVASNPIRKFQAKMQTEMAF